MPAADMPGLVLHFWPVLPQILKTGVATRLHLMRWIFLARRSTAAAAVVAEVMEHCVSFSAAGSICLSLSRHQHTAGSFSLACANGRVCSSTVHRYPLVFTHDQHP